MAGARAAQNLDALVRAAANRSVRKFAGQFTADEIPPQPPLDVEVIRNKANAHTADEVDRAIADGMQAAFRHAQAFAPRAGGGYRVTGVNTIPPMSKRPGPVDAAMYGMTPDEMMQKWWGDAWPEVRAQIEKNPTPPIIRYPAASSTAEHLDNPFYTFMVKGDYPSHMAGNGRSVVINPDQAAKYGADPSVVTGHEAGHWIAPMRGQYRAGDSPIPRARINEILLKNYRDWMNDKPGVMQALASRLQHISRPSEMAAYFNHFLRQNYAVTGRPTITPEDRVRLMTEIARGEPVTRGVPAKKYYEMFPGAPEMQHGPMKGQPAEGYDLNKEMLRLLLPELTPGQKRDVMDATKYKGASTTDPNEKVYV